MDNIIDIHCHVDLPIGVGLVDRYRAGGVGAIVINSSTPDDWNDIIDACDAYPDFCYGAIGVHPWCAGDIGVDWKTKLQKLLAQNPKLMIGEIGLDKHYPDMDVQMQICGAQMALAHDMMRPVQVHCVGAWDKMLHILAHNANALPPIIIMHGFSAGMEITEQLLRFDNVYFSFAPRIISMPNKEDMINSIPAGRILVESDSDAPGDILRIVRHLANMRETPSAQLATQIYNNSIMVINNG